MPGLLSSACKLNNPRFRPPIASTQENHVRIKINFLIIQLFTFFVMTFLSTCTPSNIINVEDKEVEAGYSLCLPVVCASLKFNAFDCKSCSG